MRWRKVRGQNAHHHVKVERAMLPGYVLASFGFTPRQIKANNVALDAGAADIGAGHFKGTVEPTVDATHHVDGGCRALSSKRSRRTDCNSTLRAMPYNQRSPTPTPASPSWRYSALSVAKCTSSANLQRHRGSHPLLRCREGEARPCPGSAVAGRFSSARNRASRRGSPHPAMDERVAAKPVRVLPQA